jgi:hypothetical protein
VNIATQSAKVGCRYQLRLEVWQYPGQAPIVQPVVLAPHTGHTPGSKEDAVLLRPDRQLEDKALYLLKMGIKPMQVGTCPATQSTACQDHRCL